MPAIFILAICSFVNGQERTFVSGKGNDASPCTRMAPCRTFQRGYNVVAAGGEVVALDAAGYGSLTISKSVTITGEGTYAGITAASGDGIFIGSATAVVVLRNLSIYGLGTGINGIEVPAAASLHIENCVIQGFASAGLFVTPSGNTDVQTFVKDTVMRDNNANFVTAGRAIFENCRFEKNGVGLDVRGAKATVHNCVVAGNPVRGLSSSSTGGQIMVDSCQISGNGAGIVAEDNGQVRVSNSEITNNSVGLATATGGTILSRATAAGASLTNTVEDNGSDGAFTGIYLAK